MMPLDEKDLQLLAEVLPAPLLDGERVCRGEPSRAGGSA